MSDLDARVAALMQKILLHCAAYKRAFISKTPADHDAFLELDIDLHQSIRAELQKPALHEPVTDAEVYSALNRYTGNPGLDSFTNMQNMLEYFLQGRAQPAQKSLTNADLWAIWQTVDTGAIDPDLVAFARAVIRASKGEKT